jgi:predicted ATPase
MELQLKNIGMIKEANVKIDGLTLIAGENDTGKSTVGKALYLMIKSRNKSFIKKETEYSLEELMRIKIRGIMINLFKSSKIFTLDSYISLNDNILKYKKSSKDYINWQYDGDCSLSDMDIIFIETPLVWNFTDFFRDIAQIESQIDIKLDYPYLMKDLNFKLRLKNAVDGFDIKKQMTDLMGGEFKKDEMGRYYFDKNGEEIDLINTATGIKYFGIFQILSQNNYLNENTVLILDEPEVHLHPKWQLEMAKVIVELVKSGVKIVVNSHSPYMIDALKRYSEVEEIEDKTNFYLAEDGMINKVEDSNALTLEKIFEKLSEPFDVFDEMDSERLQNG